MSGRIVQRRRRKKTVRSRRKEDTMMGYRRISWICWLATSIAFCASAVMAQVPGTRVVGPSTGERADGPPCRATGEACFLGIDPDIYGMPLLGQYIQSGDRLICATQNWSSFPPESFSIDFLRHSWSLMMPMDQATTEGTAFWFLTTHWGPPDVPAADLSVVATPADFTDEVFSNLQERTFRIEFEVPKSDFEQFGWQPASLAVSIPPDPSPTAPLKLRGWYIKGDGVAGNGDGENPGREDRGKREHPLVILSAGFPYSIAFNQPVGGIAVGRQLRKTATYLVAQGYDVLFFDKRGHGYSEGFLDGMGEDIFRALDLLERGTIIEENITLSLSIITPED